MKKWFVLVVVCLLAIVMLLTGCSAANPTAMPETIDAQTAVQESNSGQAYIFCNDHEAEPRGLYRYDLDGGGRLLIAEGIFSYVGKMDGLVYFIDNESRKLLSADLDGKNTVTLGNANYGIQIDKTIWFHDGDSIFQIEDGGAIREIAQFPDDLQKPPLYFYKDAQEIYFVIQGSYMEGLDLFSCDAQTGEITQVMADIDECFAVRDGCVYHHGFYAEERDTVFCYQIVSGENEAFYQAGGEILEMFFLGDWLMLVTIDADGFQLGLEGYCAQTGETYHQGIGTNNVWEVASDIFITLRESGNGGLAVKLVLEDEHPKMIAIGE